MTVYETYHKNLNPIYTDCLHNCIYCYMYPLKKRFPEKFSPGFYIKRLEAKRNLKNKTFFVCSNCDIFDHSVKDKWIEDTIKYIVANFDPSNTICMLTKNPRRYLDYLDIIPINWLLGVTIETDINLYASKYSKAPAVFERFRAMLEVKESHSNIYLMIEPILDFDYLFFNCWLSDLEAKYYIFGANSRSDIQLIEPSSFNIQNLIKSLEEQEKIVIIKHNMKRLGFEPQIGYLNKNNSNFIFEKKSENTTLVKYLEL